MRPRRNLAVAIGLTCSVATAGCGLGAGESVGGVTLTVTRDYGAERLLARSDSDVPESETAMRLLDRNAEISTRYGGGFVQSVAGLEGGTRDGRPFDWFFYVNGVESPIGAAEYDLHDGDRVWWDYRDWGAAMRVPAVVGSFPEPFLHGYEGKRRPVEVVCVRFASDTCETVRERLQELGARPEAGADEPIRVLVGTWASLRDDNAAALIESGPQSSGVFADLEPTGDGFALELLDAEGETSRRLLKRAGLVAATREGDDPPTWVVTGTDPAGVRAGVRLLDPEDLRDRYAVAVSGRREIGVPVP